jgi:hypothetical protein
VVPPPEFQLSWIRLVETTDTITPVGSGAAETVGEGEGDEEGEAVGDAEGDGVGSKEDKNRESIEEEAVQLARIAARHSPPNKGKIFPVRTNKRTS